MPRPVCFRGAPRSSSPSQDPTPPTKSILECTHGCLLMVDIKGFSTLAEELTEWDEGPERLIVGLNDYFGPMIEDIRRSDWT